MILGLAVLECDSESINGSRVQQKSQEAIEAFAEEATKSRWRGDFCAQALSAISAKGEG
jgi:hypothetical protein